METAVTYPDGVPGITTSGRIDGVKPRVVRTLLGLGSGAKYGVHNASPNNLVRGIAERVLYLAEGGKLRSTPRPASGVFERLKTVRNRLLRSLRPTPVCAMEDYPLLYNGRKRKVYERAVESLFGKSISRVDSYVSTFVKAEKVNFTAKPDPAPRVIQPRSPRYNVCVGRYLKPFEHEVVRGFQKAFGYSVVCKGMNADQVGCQIHENWTTFADPVAVGLDAHRFDQHVSVEALQFEHSIYNSVFRSRELAQLLGWQLHNKGFGRIDNFLAKYTTEGCRMSGDINTGLGNCIIMSMLVLNYFEENQIKARLTNNGDDCVVICDRCDLHKLDRLTPYFLEFGFRLAREPTVDVLERVVFCQSQPVLVGNEYRMVRNPWTAMSKDCVSLLSWSDPAQFDTWRSAIGTCGRELTRGVPVWEKFYANLRGTNPRLGGLESVYDSGLGFMARGVKEVRDITPESRYSFWLAFDILPDLQTALESETIPIEYDTPTPMTLAQISSFPTPLSCLTVKTTNA